MPLGRSSMEGFDDLCWPLRTPFLQFYGGYDNPPLPLYSGILASNADKTDYSLREWGEKLSANSKSL